MILKFIWTIASNLQPYNKTGDFNKEVLRTYPQSLFTDIPTDII